MKKETEDIIEVIEGDVLFILGLTFLAVVFGKIGMFIAGIIFIYMFFKCK